jgi:hypothetical protein
VYILQFNRQMAVVALTTLMARLVPALVLQTTVVAVVLQRTQPCSQLVVMVVLVLLLLDIHYKENINGTFRTS